MSEQQQIEHLANSLKKGEMALMRIKARTKNSLKQMKKTLKEFGFQIGRINQKEMYINGGMTEYGLLHSAM
jgi:hypothetical protein